MGTKNDPGRFDCYANAEPDEPMFVLLGRDPLAPILVKIWAEMRKRSGEDPAKVDEAIACAADLFQWALLKGKGEQVAGAAELLVKTLADFTSAKSAADVQEAKVEMERLLAKHGAKRAP